MEFRIAITGERDLFFSRHVGLGSNSEVRRCHCERPLLGQQRGSISVIPGPEGVEKSWREAELGAVDDGAFVYWLWRDRERLAAS